MLTANAPPMASRSWIRALRSMHTNTSGGSSDSDEKAVTVMPARWPSANFAVTTVTPAAKWPNA